jgi:hypothetical protein
VTSAELLQFPLPTLLLTSFTRPAFSIKTLNPKRISHSHTTHNISKEMFTNTFLKHVHFVLNYTQHKTYVITMRDLRSSRRRVWRLDPSTMQRRVVSLEQTDVSEVHTAPIIRVIKFIALMMEAVHTSETSGLLQRNYTALHPRKLLSSCLRTIFKSIQKSSLHF